MATRRIRLLSPEHLARNASASSLWVSYKGNVYDVTEFAQDHPGGDDLVLRYAGKDVEHVMQDPSEHSHSDSAFELLREQPIVGRLATTDEEKKALADAAQEADFSGKDADVVITDDFQPADTDLQSDFSKHAFLDLSRPLIPQMWNCTFSKDFYLKQVHAPRHLRDPARLFGQWYLEMFTRTPWYVVPVVWLPLAAGFFYRSMSQFAQGAQPSPTDSAAVVAAAAAKAASLPALAASTWNNITSVLGRSGDTALLAASASASSPSFASSLPLSSPLSALSTGAQLTVLAFFQTFACFLAGIVVWTILEYGLHRFLFHVDEFLPDRPFFLMLHFLLHGIHHYLPMDRLRLVMPPLLFAALSAPFLKLAHALFPPAVANGVIAGSYFMYVGYDMTHCESEAAACSLHHTKLPEYVRKLKQYHLEHHYKNYEAGFGVTSRFWDWVFGTEL